MSPGKIRRMRMAEGSIGGAPLLKQHEKWRTERLGVNVQSNQPYTFTGLMWATRPSNLKSWSLDVGHAVERREALRIAEHRFRLDGHETIDLNKQLPLGGVAQIDGDVDIGYRA